MSARQIDIPPEVEQAGKRFGYGVAVVINLALLVVVQQILGWGWLPFLTDDFVEVIPWISFSLVVTIAANLVYQFNDTAVVKSTGQILVNLISILTTVQVLLVFPFDFSAYTFDWEIVVRVVLVLAIVGAGIGALTEAFKLASGAAYRERRRRMSTTSEVMEQEVQADSTSERRLYRSRSQRIFAGICGGLGEYLDVDPVWFRIGFVVLALGGGSGILIYLLMWLIIQPTPDGYDPAPSGRSTVTGAAVVGVVFMVAGTVALLNTIAPSMGQYIWPVIFVVGGLALLIGGLNRDNH